MLKDFLYYETLLLLKPDVTDMQVVGISKEIAAIFKKHNATELAFDNWGKTRLAYPVKKEDYGVYILIRYSVPKETLKQCLERLDLLFRVAFNEIVMRHADVKMTEATISLPYKKPANVATQGSDKSSSKMATRFVANVDADGHGSESTGESLGSSKLVLEE